MDHQDQTAIEGDIGFITCPSDKMPYYFPTVDEPDFVPTEPPFTPDDQLAVDSLRRLGQRVIPVVWGTGPQRLTSFQRVVMRSAWDFMDTGESRKRFVKWVRALGLAQIPLENSVNLMLWLLDKHYLADFEKVGISIVPTVFLNVGTDVGDVNVYGPVILKPAVSGAAQGLFHLQNSDDLERHRSELQSALREGDYLQQPFIPEICSEGEWSLVFIDGNYSHAVHKLPGKDSILVQAELGGTVRPATPPETVVSFGNQVMSVLGRAYSQGTGYPSETPLYLRMDIIPTADGPLLSECEGVEPELFFRARPGSEEDFAKALIRRM